jgi:hypothetical protein
MTRQLLERSAETPEVRFCMVEFVHNSKDIIMIDGDVNDALRDYFMKHPNGQSTISWLKNHVTNTDISSNEINKRLID